MIPESQSLASQQSKTGSQMSSTTFKRRSILCFGFGGVASAALLPFASPTHAAPLKLRADLKGSSEVPPNQTTGNGTVTVTFDPTTKRNNVEWRILGTERSCHGGAFSGAG